MKAKFKALLMICPLVQKDTIYLSGSFLNASLTHLVMRHSEGFLKFARGV